MPERQRGRDPNKGKVEQHVSLPQYHQARRYTDELTSNTAYEGVRQVLYETSCELSAYRTILLPNMQWHILVLGEKPDEMLGERIEGSLLQGEAVELPEDVWRAFNQRRLEQTVKGPWVERRTPRRRIR